MEDNDLNTFKVNQLKNKPEYIAPQLETYGVELIQSSGGPGNDGGTCLSFS